MLCYIFIFSSASCRRNDVGTIQGLQGLVKNVPSLPPEDLMLPPRLTQQSSETKKKRKKGKIKKEIGACFQSETFSKIASSFSFCKGAVTRLPLKCDRSTMGRDLEEVQWHYTARLASVCSQYCLLHPTPSLLYPHRIPGIYKGL